MHGNKKIISLCIFICMAMYMDMTGDNKEIFDIVEVHIYAG